MDDYDDAFKGMVDDGEDGSVADEIESDLNQVRPDLASQNLDADGLVDFDREVATNKPRPLSVDETVNKYLPQPVETIEHGRSEEDEVPNEPKSPPSRNETNKTTEILDRLTLVKTDLDLDPLLLKVSIKINQKRLDKMKLSFISDFLKKNQKLQYSDSHISVNLNNIFIEKDINVSDKKNLRMLLFLSLYNTLHPGETSPAYIFLKI